MIRRSLSQRFLILGTVFAGSGVAAGAFGAHTLKGILDAPMLQVFDTSTRYQMYHKTRSSGVWRLQNGS